MTHYTGTTTNTLFVTGPKKLQFIRLTISNGLVSASESFSDSSTASLKAAAVYVIDQNNLAVLMFGTVSAIPNQVVLATLNFGSLTLSY